MWLLLHPTTCIIIASSVTSLIVLSFDGSLRHPSDPGNPVSHLPKIASSAACIIDDDGSLRKASGQLHSREVSSAECEYLGLILGLEELMKILQTEKRTSQYSIKCCVQGDSKTVISQMQGNARSRKLECYFNTCQALLNGLSSEGVEFDFQHVPREQNSLADHIASLVLKNKERQEEIKLLDKLTSASLEVQDVERLVRFYFLRPSIIVLSARVRIYEYLASFTIANEEYELLKHIGELYERDLRLLKRSYSNAVNIQLLACTRSNNTVDEKRLLLKHKHLLGLHDNKFIFYESNNRSVELRNELLLRSKALSMELVPIESFTP